MASVLILNGPNLNMLGTREPAVYGHDTLDDINAMLTTQAQLLGHTVVFKQTNAEHELVEFIQQAKTAKVSFIIINPAAFTHTSIALRDALLSVGLPFIEVHLSNPHARESFRRHSYLSDIAEGVICGFGAQSYALALQAADKFLKK